MASPRSQEEWRESVTAMLAGINKYNPENIEMLEQYVDFQADAEDYNFEANLALMKLYQFQPHRYNHRVACHILLKSVMILPETNFTLLMAVLPLNQQTNEDIERISELHKLLESCQFCKFWDFLLENDELVEGITGFHKAISHFIVDLLNNTYQSMSVELLKSYLGGINDKALVSLAREQEWKLEGKMVHIRGHEENIRPKRILAKIDFENVAGIIMSAKS